MKAIIIDDDKRVCRIISNFIETNFPEDGTDRVFNKAKKIDSKTKKEINIKKMIQELADHGISTVGAFMLNVPKHNKTNLKEDMKKHMELDVMASQFSSMTPYPGTPFFEKFKSVKPYFIPKKEITKGEFLQSPKEKKEFDPATKCINCGACYSACPVLDQNSQFLGPAALVHAARFIFDSRELGLKERINILDQPNGVWACENHFECTQVCPRGIPVTKFINLTKRKIKKYREE